MKRHEIITMLDASNSPSYYEDLVATIRAGDPVSWVRYGDGEFKVVYRQLKPKPGNINGQHRKDKNKSRSSGFERLPNVANRVRAELDNPTGVRIGIGRLLFCDRHGVVQPQRTLGDRIVKDFPDIEWCSAETLRDVSPVWGLDALFEALAERDVVVVGPEYLDRLQDVFPFHHITIPEAGCFDILDDVKEQCQQEAAPGRVMLFMASVMTNILIHELYPGNEDTSFLDIGSAFDPYCGVRTRTYHGKFTPHIFGEPVG